MLPRPSMPSFLTRYWFPLALIGLLVLAIPGAVLFALHLSGHDSALNQWFEKDYQLSYHLSIPWWGALILLLLPVAILILYFLKLKRKPLSVPSTFLWRKSIEDLHVNSLLQWLRQNVLLLLQLLVLLALIYGVMAFRFHGTGGEGKPYILMIDNSASMSATDVEPSRLEWAKQEALKEIDAHTDRDVGMVIVFNSSAEIRQSFTSNRILLRDAVRRIEATQRTTRIEEALNLADSLANPVRSTENVASQPDNPEAGKERTYVPPKGTPTDVHLYSDGRFPDLSDAALANMNSRLAGNESALGSLSIQYHLAGTPGPENLDNVGIVTFNALRDDTDATRIQVFVRVMNFRTTPVNPRVRLEVHEEGQLKNVYEQTLSMPGRKVVAETEASKEENRREFPDASATFPLNDIDGRRQVMLYARLLDVKDKFPLDDEAWLVVSAPRKARVLHVGPYNEALGKFFSAQEVQEVARLDELTAKDLTEDTYRKAARNGTYDLVIFDRCAPAREEDMPRSNTFFIGYPPPPWKKEQAEKFVNPSITGWTTSHPVLRDLRALYTIGIAEAFKVKWPPRTPALIEGRKITPQENTPVELLVALTRQSFTDLVLTFPIVSEDGKWNTDWWLQTSFPLFLRNVLFTLGNLNENAIEDTVQPGMIKKIRPDGTVQSIEVVDPEGAVFPQKHDERESRTDFAFGMTERVGVYRVKWDGGVREQFAVNLLDAEESNIEPRPAFQIGSDQIEAGQQRGQPRELWKWFALLALGALMVEWYVYNRRVYV